MFKITFLLLVSMVTLFAQKGDVSIFVLKDGKALLGAKVIIDSNITVTTDKDGFVNVGLTSGKHQAVIDVIEKGQIIAHARHNFIIAPDQNTEVIVSLSEEGKVTNIDSEASADVAKFADVNGTSEISAVLVKVEGVIVSSKDNKPVA